MNPIGLCLDLVILGIATLELNDEVKSFKCHLDIIG